MSKRKLIVNADDLGQSDGINKGILDAHEIGIVTSASLMVRYDAATDAAYHTYKYPELGIGLHVDLGEWNFNGHNWEPIYEVVNLYDLHAVEAEINKQLDLFYKYMHKKPTHIDSHQHIHNRKLMLPIFQKLANELNITLRGQSNRVKYCGDFYGQDINGNSDPMAISIPALKQIIKNLPEGITEMACHPGINTEIDTMYKLERDYEVLTLTDSSVKEFIKAENIELISFNDLE